MNIEITNILYWRTTKYKRNIKRISYHLTICFLQKIQPWGLFHLDETTNVFLHDLSRFLISYWQNVINLSSQWVDKIGLNVCISLRTGVAFFGKKMSANQNAHKTFFTFEKIPYNQSKRSCDKFNMWKI